MVRCGTCGGDNRDGARFCATCGAGLPVGCPACGAVPARAEARFCDTCGTELAVGAAPGDQARKVVTVLFADLVGSTSAQEGVDPEAVRRWVDRYYAVLRREVEAHGGRAVKFTGDGVMAVFGIPEVREDDARRAIECGAALHDAVAELDDGAGAPDRVAIRVGINTGEVVVSAVEDDVVGDVVNVAARLQSAAEAGQTLVGESTFRLVRLGAQLRALPPLDLKGKSVPVNAFLLTSLAREEEAEASPFVGRAGEIERLLAVLESAIADRRARLASIVGSPGVGKTRLTRELAARAAGRARVVEVRCEGAGGATFAPIAAALRQATSLDDDAADETVLAALTALFDEEEADRHRIAAGVASILGVGDPVLPEEIFWAVRRLIENAGRREPIVFVFDDVHSAEPLLLDLIENVAEWTRDVPVMLLLTARPELRDLRPSLVETGGRVQAAINLEGLAVDESRRLTRELVGGADLPDALLDRVASASEGNPLYVGELVRMLVDDGVLELEGGAGRITIDLAELEVPVTIHALLGARLDRLTPGERAVLEAASVVGKTFYRGAVAALLPAEVAAHLDDHLEALRRKELVEPAGTYWLDEPVLRFHHVLIQDAAYRRLLKEHRADLHERTARWLDVKLGDLSEHDDVVGYQLEQAHALRVEAGEPAAALGLEAARRLAAAGRRSLEADDRPVAASLLGRALACLPPDDHGRGGLLIDRCEALLAMGDATEAAGAVADLLDVAAGDPRLEAWASCFAGELANLRDAGALAATAAAADAAALHFEELDDAAGEAKAHAVRAASLVRLGRIAECESALDRALAAARRAGERRRATAILAGAPIAALWGPNPVTRASGRCLDVVRVLRITNRAPAVEATSLRCQAVLEALRGRDDAARRMLGSARRSLEDLGHEHGLLEVDLAAGMVELLGDRPEEAEPLLRRAHEGFHALGIDVDAGLAAALLARVRLAVGEAYEALELTVESEKLGGDDLKAGIAWRAVRAEALAHRGDLERARRLAEDAVALAAPTDALLDHADALLALAQVLRAAGEPLAAAERAGAALALYDRKEASVPAARARALAGPAAVRAGAPVADEHLAAAGSPTGSAANQASRLAEEMYRYAARNDADGFLRLCRTDVRVTDRRPLLGGSEVTGWAGYRQLAQSALDVGVREVMPRVLEVRGDRLVLVAVRFGPDPGRSEAGGAVEVLHVVQVDRDGLLADQVMYDPEQLVEAVAELDRRAAALANEVEEVDGADGLDHLGLVQWALAARGVPLENAATRFCVDWVPALIEGQWDRLRTMFADGIVGLDHRPVLGEVDPLVGKDAVIAGNQGVIAMGVTSLEVTPLVLGGDRAVLTRADYGGSAGSIGVLQLAEVDEEGRLLRSEVFDLDQRDLALQRLRVVGDPSALPDNRASRTVRQVYERCLGHGPDVRALVHDDALNADHRLIVGGVTTAGGDAFVELLEGIRAVGVGSVDIDVLDTRGQDRCLLHVEMHGSQGDVQVLQLAGLADDGRVQRSEIFEVRQLDEAVGRLDALVPGSGPELSNDASRRFLSLIRSGADDTWRVRVDELADDIEVEDHRPLVGGYSLRGRDAAITFIESVQGAGVASVDGEVLATRGARLALSTAVYSGARGSMETMAISGLDADGRLVSVDLYEPDQLDEALAELDDRYGRSLPPPLAAVWEVNRAGIAAINRGDLQGLAGIYTEDLVLVDRRPAAWGAVTRDEVVDVYRMMFERGADVHDVVTEVVHLSDRGTMLRLEERGTLDGGPFRFPMVTVSEARDGLLARVDVFAPEAWAEAEARWEELSATDT